MSGKAHVKHSLARIWGTASRALGGGTRRIRAPIMCFHSINETPDDYADPLSPAVFEDFLRYATEHYDLIPLDRLLAGIRGEADLPPRPAAITFDDGYGDNYTVARPLLEKHEAPATFFLVSGFLDGELDLIGKPEWAAMSWDEIRQMAASPLFDFGAHTHRHISLSQLTGNDAVAEIDLSKQRLESELGRPAPIFAYPNGQGSDISKVAVDHVSSGLFDGACSTFWRSTHAADERFLVNRIMVSGSDTVDVLAAKMRGDYDYLYYVQKAKSLQRKLVGGKGVW